jgi:hypothetical protein
MDHFIIRIVLRYSRHGKSCEYSTRYPFSRKITSEGKISIYEGISLCTRKNEMTESSDSIPVEKVPTLTIRQAGHWTTACSPGCSGGRDKRIVV